MLTKGSGPLVPLGLFLYGLANKSKQLIKVAVGSLVVEFGLFVGYGAFHNWQYLVDAYRQQAGRDIGLIIVII